MTTDRDRAPLSGNEAAVRQWADDVDPRDLSDEAYHFADDEPERLMPTNVGEWRASLAIAFDAGRMLERLRR